LQRWRKPSIKIVFPLYLFKSSKNKASFDSLLAIMTVKNSKRSDQMSKLREKMKMDLELKGYASNTQTAYLKSVEKFALYHGRSPDLLGTDEIKQYLHYLITTMKVSHSYISTAYSALKFFYETTLGREWNMKEIPRSKKPKKLPVILSPSEIQDIFEAINNPKHKAILMTIYGGGLRASEVAHLKVTDIDSKNMTIRVNQGKGKKDRYTLLSQKNLNVLREYWSYYHPHDWLFPGIPITNSISTRSIQKIFEKAKDEAGIKKPVSAHTLRHCFATHLLEQGISLYHIQHLLGHSNPKTTNVYIHLTRRDILSVKSPLDLMEELR
jgi:integrase/recombinase XerD